MHMNIYALIFNANNYTHHEMDRVYIFAFTENCFNADIDFYDGFGIYVECVSK